MMENFWVKPVWMIHDVSLKRKQMCEAIMEIDDKIEKNRDGIKIDELVDPDEKYQEINTDNEGETKMEDDIRDDTDIPVTKEEEVGKDNLNEAEDSEIYQC